MNKKGTKIGMMLNRDSFTEPKICPAHPTSEDVGKSWFVWFRFFDEKKKKWILIRKKSGINHCKKFRDKLNEAKALRSEIQELLYDGWNPLKPKNGGRDPFAQKTFITLLEEMYQIKKASIRTTSYKNYRIAKDYLVNWLKDTGKEDIYAKDFNSKMANAFLDTLSLRKITNTTWNNYKEATQFLLNMFVNREIIGSNPFSKIKNKKANPKRNKAFTDRELKIIWDYLKEEDPYLYRFSLVLFYCYIRPKEITRIQVKEVFSDRFYIPAEKSKNRKDGYPRIPKTLKKELMKMNTQDYPGDFFIFGNLSQSRKSGTSIQEKQGRSVTISDNFRKVFKKLGITDRNLYSFKHTGVVAAYKAGVKIKAIQIQLRHHSLEETDIYLRDLGVGVNDEYLEVDY